MFPRDEILQLNHNRITLGNDDSNGAGKHTEVLHTEGSVIFDDRDASACDPRSSVHARSLLKDHWVTPIEAARVSIGDSNYFDSDQNEIYFK